MSKSVAERQRERRERLKALDVKDGSFTHHIDDRERVRDYALKLIKKRGIDIRKIS